MLCKIHFEILIQVDIYGICLSLYLLPTNEYVTQYSRILHMCHTSVFLCIPALSFSSMAQHKMLITRSTFDTLFE